MPVSPAATLSLQLNGEPNEQPAGTTLAQLVEALGKDPRTLAVERNGGIVPRGTYGEVVLADGDRLEIVHFVQGG